MHLVNLQSLQDLGRIAGTHLDPARFRANIYIQGLPQWAERQWLGKTIMVGEAKLKVFAETGRCEAISVVP
jgi:uncharacterized protein